VLLCVKCINFKYRSHLGKVQRERSYLKVGRFVDRLIGVWDE
jgi:hypothetical protein